MSPRSLLLIEDDPEAQGYLSGLLRRDDRDAGQYVDNIVKTGREAHHRRAEVAGSVQPSAFSFQQSGVKRVELCARRKVGDSNAPRIELRRSGRKPTA